MMSLVVVGSVAYDSVETPHGRRDRMLGGACTYIALSASYFTDVHIVAVVGDDFDRADENFLASRKIDLEGLEVRKGRTFRWSGRYHEDMNVRDTLDLQLNVFSDFSPVLPARYRNAPFVFLANINPGLQGGVLDQLTQPRLIACDTISHWIEGARPELEALLKKVEQEALRDANTLARHILDDAKAKAEEKARRILTVAIQRYAGEHTFESTTASIVLPSGDDIKGRIIGREGRNIRAFEAATGVDIIIDETPDAVTIGAHPITDRLAVDSNLPLLKILEEIDAAKQGRFSRTARSQHDHNVALVDIEAE